MINDWAKILDKKGQVDTFILDFEKAFDTPPHRAARFVTGNYVFETGSMTGILGQLKWESLKKRRKDSRLILLYKGLKGKARIPTDDLIPKNRRCRNQHSLAFQIPSASKEAYKSSFDIVNFPFLDGDVPRRASYGVYISQLIRFARVCNHVTDFNARNKCLTAKLLQQGYRYHKLRKTFSKFYRRHYELISKYNVGLKTLLSEGLSEPEFYGDLVYKLKKLKGINDFSLQFGKIISRYRRIGYNLNVMRQSACLVFNPIMVDNYAAFFNCTPVGRASDSMMAPT